MSANGFSTAIADKQAELLLIKAPDKVGSLVVGKSNYADVISILGNPDFAESKKITITNQEILDLKYPLKGIEFTIDKNKQMRVARIEVYKPFAGSSAEGIYLGMPIEKAKQIISDQFGSPHHEFSGYVAWRIPNMFALKHENGVVVAIKMLGE